MLDVLGLILSNASKIHREYRDNQSIKYTYVVDRIDLAAIAKQLNKPTKRPKIHILNFQSFKGVYLTDSKVDCLIMTWDGFSNDHIDIFDQSTDSKCINELQAYGKKHGIQKFYNLNFDCFISLLVCVAKSVEFRYCLKSIEDSFAIKMSNTYLKFLKTIDALKHSRIKSGSTHIFHFSFLYFHELEAIEKFADNQKAGIVVHDVGTNMGFLPIILAGLNENKRCKVKMKTIIGSDIELNTFSLNLNRIRTKEKEAGRPFPSLKRIKTERIDVLKVIPKKSKADVVIANDLIEHFEEEHSVRAIKNLWESTRDLLLIHVPFEKKPVPAYGHFRSFDTESLRQMAKHLKGAIDVTPSKLRAHGFLHLKKNKKGL